MSTGVIAIVAAFKDEQSADNAYNSLKRSDNKVWLQDVAIVVHDGDKIRFKESGDMGGAKGAAVGGVLGALTGLLFPPAMLAIAVGGALIGGLGAKMHDGGLKDDNFKRIGKEMQPGSAAIIAMVDEGMVNQATDALKRLGASVTTEGLDDESVKRLKDAASASAPEAPAAAPEAPAAAEQPPPEAAK